MAHHQATRANRAQIVRHIQCQRILGEDMPRHEAITWRELLGTAALLAVFFSVIHYLGL